jgi:sugar lactone lactonase YvrE
MRVHCRVRPAGFQWPDARPAGTAYDQRTRQPSCHSAGEGWTLDRAGRPLPGKRLNSPNDLVYRSDGALYFTDPPFGLPKSFDDPRKELPFSGVYRWHSGKLQLLATDLTGPNGLAFPPDEKYLYVANWDTHNKLVMRYPVNAEGTLAKGEVFFDMTDALDEEALDGLKVDQQGHLYVSGPGGIWILSPHRASTLAPSRRPSYRPISLGAIKTARCSI